MTNNKEKLFGLLTWGQSARHMQLEDNAGWQLCTVCSIKRKYLNLHSSNKCRFNTFSPISSGSKILFDWSFTSHIKCSYYHILAMSPLCHILITCIAYIHAADWYHHFYSLFLSNRSLQLSPSCGWTQVCTHALLHKQCTYTHMKAKEGVTWQNRLNNMEMILKCHTVYAQQTLLQLHTIHAHTFIKQNTHPLQKICATKKLVTKYCKLVPQDTTKLEICRSNDRRVFTLLCSSQAASMGM